MKYEFLITFVHLVILIFIDFYLANFSKIAPEPCCDFTGKGYLNSKLMFFIVFCAEKYDKLSICPRPFLVDLTSRFYIDQQTEFLLA